MPALRSLRSFASVSAALATVLATSACHFGAIPIGTNPCTTSSDCPGGAACLDGVCAGSGASGGEIGGVGGSVGCSGGVCMSVGSAGGASGIGMVGGGGSPPSTGHGGASSGFGGSSFGSGGAPGGGMSTGVGGAPSGGMSTGTGSGTGTTCNNDGDCRAGQTCVDGICTGPCISATCLDLGFDCGEAADGCGGVVLCGSCPSGQTCGASTPNHCG